MFARNVQWAALLMFAFAVHTSCSQQDEPAGGVAGAGEIVTSVGVNVPDLFKTRTATLDHVYAGEGERYWGTSGMPSLGNVDLSEHPLTFTVGVYIKKKGGTEYVLVDRQSHAAHDDNAYFEFRLLKGQQYRLVAYADFNGEKADLESISFATALNDERSDAFFASEDFVAAENIQVVLKRPFGKLRLVAHDFNTLAAGEAFKINKVTVKYHRAPMLATDTFNALTGEFNYDAAAEGEHTVEAVPVVYTREYTDDGKAEVDASGKEGPVAIFTMYLPANYGEGGPLNEDTTEGLNPDPDPDHVDAAAVPQSWFYPFDVVVEYENANGGTTGVKTIERSYTIDIPVKRNWLTTVDAAHFWTDNSGIMVTVDAAFDGEIKVEEAKPKTVNTAVDLQAAIDDIYKNAPNGISQYKIVLGQDIDATDRIGFTLYNTADGTANTAEKVNRIIKIHLDLNGHTITTNATANPNGYVGGLIEVLGVGSHLYIDDTSKEQVGGLKFEDVDNTYAYPLVCCRNGGQVTINKGNFVTSSPSEAVYVYESERHRSQVQRWILQSTLKNTVDANLDSETRPTFTEAEEAAIIKNLKQWSASLTINGGWYENAYDGSEDKYRLVINNYNARPGTYNSETGTGSGWAYYRSYTSRFVWKTLDNGTKKRCPKWTDWGEYVNQPFGFVYMNGGSVVEQDPSKGDNIVGNIPNKWIGDGHIETAIVDGKTVYTVIPKEEVHDF